MQRLGSRAYLFLEKKILKVFTIYGHGSHLGQRTMTILAIFRSLNLRRLHMKFEQNWLSGFRGDVVKNVNGRTDGRRTKSDQYNSFWAYRRWAKKNRQAIQAKTYSDRNGIRQQKHRLGTVSKTFTGGDGRGWGLKSIYVVRTLALSYAVV